MNNILSAIDFATKAHEGQTRKYTGEPYIMHPIAVAILVQSVSDNVNMHCAAILHDVVEDTDVTIEEIREEFGFTVAVYVDELTDISKLSDGNRKVRKNIDLEHLRCATNNAKTIKLADLINNSVSIIKYGGEFTEVYMQEKDALLCVLVGGSSELFDIAKKIVDDYFGRKLLTRKGVE